MIHLADPQTNVKRTLVFAGDNDNSVLVNNDVRRERFAKMRDLYAERIVKELSKTSNILHYDICTRNGIVNLDRDSSNQVASDDVAYSLFLAIGKVIKEHPEFSSRLNYTWYDFSVDKKINDQLSSVYQQALTIKRERQNEGLSTSAVDVFKPEQYPAFRGISPKNLSTIMNRYNYGSRSSQFRSYAMSDYREVLDRLLKTTNNVEFAHFNVFNEFNNDDVDVFNNATSHEFEKWLTNDDALLSTAFSYHYPIDHVALKSTASDILMNELHEQSDSIEHYLPYESDGFGVLRKLLYKYGQQGEIHAEDYIDLFSPFLTNGTDKKVVTRIFKDYTTALQNHSQSELQPLSLNQLVNAIEILEYCHNKGFTIHFPSNYNGVISSASEHEATDATTDTYFRLAIEVSNGDLKGKINLIPKYKENGDLAEGDVFSDFDFRLGIPKATASYTTKDERGKRISHEEISYSDYVRLGLAFIGGETDIKLGDSHYLVGMYNANVPGTNKFTELRFERVGADGKVGGHVPLNVYNKRLQSDVTKRASHKVYHPFVSDKDEAVKFIQEYVQNGRDTFVEMFNRESLDTLALDLNPRADFRDTDALVDANLLNMDELIKQSQLKYLHYIHAVARYESYAAYIIETESDTNKANLKLVDKFNRIFDDYPEIKDMLTLTENKITVDGYDNYQDAFADYILNKQIGTYEDGFNPEFIQKIRGYSLVNVPGQGEFSEDALLVEAIKTSDYSFDKLLGDENSFYLKRMADSVVKFDQENSRSALDILNAYISDEEKLTTSDLVLINQYFLLNRSVGDTPANVEMHRLMTEHPDLEAKLNVYRNVTQQLSYEDKYFMRAMSIVEGELRDISRPVAAWGSNQTIEQSISALPSGDFDVRIDDQGVIKWRAMRRGKTSTKKDAPIEDFEVSGEIGQVFVTDPETGIIHTNFKNKENYALSPGYSGYHVSDETTLFAEDNIRLVSFFNSFANKIRSTVRLQATSMIEYDSNNHYRLFYENSNTALNSLLYGKGEDAVYAKPVDAQLLRDKPKDAAQFTEDQIKAILKTETSRIRFSNTYRDAANSTVELAYQDILNEMKRSSTDTNYQQILDEVGIKTKDVQVETLNAQRLLDLFVENDLLNDDQRTVLAKHFYVEDSNILYDLLVDPERKFRFTTYLLAEAKTNAGRDIREHFSDEELFQFREKASYLLSDASLLNDETFRSRYVNATPSTFILNGYQSVRKVTSKQLEGVFDLYVTSVGANQGVTRYLTSGAMINREGKVIPGLKDARLPLFENEAFKFSGDDAQVRQCITTSAATQAHGVNKCQVVYSAFYGLNNEDSVPINKRFAERAKVPVKDGFDDEGNPIYREKLVGDKLSDGHGNKNIISAIIDPDWTEEEAREKNLLKPWQFFHQNPDVDMVLSPYSFVSRVNAGTFEEAFDDERKDIILPNGEVLPNAAVSMNIMSLKQTVDDKGHLYEGRREGRSLSGQFVWALQSVKALDLIKNEMNNSDTKNAYVHLREYYLLLGIDFDEQLNLRLGYQAHEGERRKVFTLDATTDIDHLTNVLRSNGGFIELPFEYPTYASYMLDEALASTDPESKEYSNLIDIKAQANKLGLLRTNLLPVLPPELRRSVTYEDGSSTDHDYTRMYSEIIKHSVNYLKELDKTPDTLSSLAKNKTKIDAIENMVLRKVKQLQVDVSDKITDPDSLGKHSFYRENMMRKKIENSASLVFVSRPQAALDAINLHPDAIKHLERNQKIQSGYLLITRDPMLHENNIVALKVVPDETLAKESMGINPSIIGLLDGDFDGDVGGVYNLALDEKMVPQMSMYMRLIDYGSGLHPVEVDGQEVMRYSTMIEASGTDIALAKKVMSANPEKYKDILEKGKLLEQLCEPTFPLMVKRDGVIENVVIQNTRDGMLNLLANPDYFEAYKEQYFYPISEYITACYEEAFDASHIYTFNAPTITPEMSDAEKARAKELQANDVRKTTETIVNDKAKGKQEGVDSLVMMFLGRDEEGVKAFHIDQERATGFKSDLTGLAGAQTQKIVTMLRNLNGSQEFFNSVLTLTKRFTQGTVSLKNKGDEGIAVSRALSNFRDLLSSPTNGTLEKIVEQFSEEDRKQYPKLVETYNRVHGDDDAAGYPLDIGLTKDLMKSQLPVLGDVSDDVLDDVCVVLAKSNANSSGKDVADFETVLNLRESLKLNPLDNVARKQFDNLKVISMYQGISNAKNTIDRLAYGGKEKDLIKFSTQYLRENGKSVNLLDGGDLVENYLADKPKKLFSNESQMPLYHTMTKKGNANKLYVHLTDLETISSEFKEGVYKDLSDRVLQGKTVTKAEVIQTTVQKLHDFGETVKDKIADIQANDPISYKYLLTNPEFLIYENVAKNYQQAEVDKDLVNKAFIRENDQAVQAFAEFLLPNGDVTYRPATKKEVMKASGQKVDETVKKEVVYNGISSNVFVLDDAHINEPVTLDSLDKLHGKLPEFAPTSAAFVLKTALGLHPSSQLSLNAEVTYEKEIAHDLEVAFHQTSELMNQFFEETSQLQNDLDASELLDQLYMSNEEVNFANIISFNTAREEQANETQQDVTSEDIEITISTDGAINVEMDEEMLARIDDIAELMA